MKIKGIDIGNDMCETLGLDGKNIEEIHIHIVPNMYVTIDTVSHVNADQLKGVMKILKS
jgi:hypothetical protein